LKRKSSIALIIGIIVMLLLILIWYTLLVPSMIISELEKIDITTSYEGTYEQPMGSIPILIKAHFYAEEVKGDNIIVKMEVNTTFMDIIIPELSGNFTYVYNKFTRENVRDAPEADRPREGYDYIYPSHLKAGKNISDAWLENLNTTGTLEFKESVVEGGVKLYKYFAEETVTKEMYIPLYETRNCTLTSRKTILIEPLSGMWVYTENETFSCSILDTLEYKLLYLEYNSTAEAKAERLAEAKAIHDSLQLLELYIPAILGVVVVILVIALALNVRRLKRKKPPEPETRSPATIRLLCPSSTSFMSIILLM